MNNGVTVFSNGTQFMDWEARNCDRCPKVTYNAQGDPESHCPMWKAIADSMWQDGDFTPAMAARLGYKPGLINWDCPERDDTERKEWERREREAIECGLIVPRTGEAEQRARAGE